MNHSGKVQSGDALGNRVWWVNCECGWIGNASASEAEAWHPHRFHLKAQR